MVFSVVDELNYSFKQGSSFQLCYGMSRECQGQNLVINIEESHLCYAQGKYSYPQENLRTVIDQQHRKSAFQTRLEDLGLEVGSIKYPLQVQLPNYDFFKRVRLRGISSFLQVLQILHLYKIRPPGCYILGLLLSLPTELPHVKLFFMWLDFY